MPSTRQASHAGSWYSKNSAKLSGELDQWLSQVPDEINPITINTSKQPSTKPTPVPGARVIIAPHAGYAYSGPAAAWAYKSLDLSSCKRIFLLGPSHVMYLKGCAISSHTHYSTPLGDLELDRSTMEQLKSTGKFRSWNVDSEEEEHSLEMHLPYIHKMLSRHYKDTKDFPLLVPVLVGNLDPPFTADASKPNRRATSAKSSDDETAYGRLFAPYLSDPANVFIASSDFCHWGSRFSFTSALPDVVDRSAMAAIETGSHQAFADDVYKTKNTICGRHPIGVLMAALEAWKEENAVTDPEKGVFRFVRYERSSEIVSPRDSSVSYCSAFAAL